MSKLTLLLALFLAGCAGIVPNLIQPNPTNVPTQLPSFTPRGNPARTTPVPSSTTLIQRDLTYCTAADVALKMDLYLPPQVGKPSPVAIFVHGGGWSSGDKSSGNVIPFADLASQGH